MAPPKAAAPKKGKAPVQASQPTVASGSAGPVVALPRSRISAAGIDKVRHLAATNTNEHGATSMKPAGSSKLREGYYPILDRKSTRLNSSHITRSRMPSSA